MMSIFICSVLITGINKVQAQENLPESTITMRDSTKYVGKIIENVSTNDYFVIRLDNGDIKQIKRADVAKMKVETKSDINVDDYGSRLSIGAEIGGGGLVGIPVRFFIIKKMAVEVGVHMRPIIMVNSSSDISYHLNVFFSGELSFNFNRKYITNKRIRTNGIFVRSGFSTGKRFNEFIAAIGWQYERFKIYKKNQSFSVGVGIGIDRMRDKEAIPYYQYGGWYGHSGMVYPQEIYLKPMLYWKVAWNFHIPLKKNNK